MNKMKRVLLAAFIMVWFVNGLYAIPGIKDISNNMYSVTGSDRWINLGIIGYLFPGDDESGGYKFWPLPFVSAQYTYYPYRFLVYLPGIEAGVCPLSIPLELAASLEMGDKNNKITLNDGSVRYESSGHLSAIAKASYTDLQWEYEVSAGYNPVMVDRPGGEERLDGMMYSCEIKRSLCYSSLSTFVFSCCINVMNREYAESVYAVHTGTGQEVNSVHGGIESIDARIMYNYQLSGNTFVIVSFMESFLAGSAAESPVRPSRFETYAFVGLMHLLTW